MKKDLFLHATSLAAAQKIAVEGFDGSKGKQVWNVSGGKNYFLSVRKMFRDRYSRRWDKDVRFKEVYSEFISTAFDQATNNVALDGSSRRVTFLVDLSGLTYHKDTSCNYPTAVQTKAIVSPDRILKIWVDKWDVTCMLPIWRKRLENHQMSNVQHSDNPWENLIAESASNLFLQCDDVDDTWRETTLDALKNA